MSDDQEQLTELLKRAGELGFRVIEDRTWGHVLWRIDRPTTDLHTHSNASLDHLREMLESIEWGLRHGTVQLD